MNEVEHKVKRCKSGTLFFLDSFPKVSEEYANNKLIELTKSGELVRISKGIYLKPERTRFGIVYPSIDRIVELIAARDKAQVLPCGQTALNMLGLSEQVPASGTYVTSGSARSLTINGRIVTLRRSVPKTFAPRNRFMAILFLALKAWHEDEITPAFTEAVCRVLRQSDMEKQSMLADLKLAPKWIRTYLTPIINAL